MTVLKNCSMLLRKLIRICSGVKKRYIRFITILAIFILSGTWFIAPNVLAQTGTQITTVANGQTWALNMWGGGADLKTYGPNVYNDNFLEQFIYGRCQAGSDLTTTNCPLPGTPPGYFIVQIKETGYVNGNLVCVGDYNGYGNRADAEDLDICNDPNTGFGGDYGTVFILFPDACSTNIGTLINVHWSSTWTNAREIAATFTANGQQFYLNVDAAYCYTLSNMT